MTQSIGSKAKPWMNPRVFFEFLIMIIWSFGCGALFWIAIRSGAPQAMLALAVFGFAALGGYSLEKRGSLFPVILAALTGMIEVLLGFTNIAMFSFLWIVYGIFAGLVVVEKAWPVILTMVIMTSLGLVFGAVLFAI